MATIVVHFREILRCLTLLIKILGRNVNGIVEPCDRPAIEGEVGEHVLVAQWGEELVLIDERLAVEDDTATVVEVQLQQVVAHDAGGSDPFQSVCLFHIVSIKWVNLDQFVVYEGKCTQIFWNNVRFARNLHNIYVIEGNFT